MIDREQVAEALAVWDRLDGTSGSGVRPESLVITEAARAWLNQGDALVIRKDEDGEWPIPDEAVEAAARATGWNFFAKIGEARVIIAAALDALSDRSDKS